MSRKNMITRAVLDGLDCVVLHVSFTPDKWKMLADAKYSELYVNGRMPVCEWVGRCVMSRCELAVCITGFRSELTAVTELRFFAKVPEHRTHAKHPEWGEPDKDHYAIPLSFPVSKVVLFAEELGHENEEE